MTQTLFAPRFFGGRYFAGRLFTVGVATVSIASSTGLYAAEHRSALVDLLAAGAAVTFSRMTPGAHNAATGVVAAPTETTVAGYAIQIRMLTASDRETYRGLGLTPAVAPMLLFAASTYGDAPGLGDTCTWNGAAYTVKGFGDPVAPDGVPILTRAVIAR